MTGKVKRKQAKQKRIIASVSFDAELFDFIAKKKNRSEYINNLVRKDMGEKKDESN